MRAAMLHEYGPPENLRVEEVPDPVPGPDQVVIDVHACGVNFPDVLMIQDLYQFKPGLPFAPGGEVSGTVSAVGPDVDGISVGDRVAASCGSGGFAEKAVANTASVLPVPDGVDLTVASAVITTYGTSYYALRDRAKLREGESLLVLGAAGGVGLATVELGAAMGAGDVIAAASSEEKLAVCREHGATSTVDYTTTDLKAWLKEHTSGRGVDVVYDPVGGDLAEPALRSMAWEGRYLVIGFAAGDIPRIPLNLPLLKGCSVVGVFWGSYAAREPDANTAMIGELFGMIADGRVHPRVSATFDLDHATEALRELMDRKVIGKAVVTP
ncbi:MAG: NADPH:quinone oxidoreductase family protein [Ilumatobacteraceae bacterium]